MRFFPEGRPIRENGEQGGIGILNVEKCVEKYGGKPMLPALRLILCVNFS